MRAKPVFPTMSRLVLMLAAAGGPAMAQSPDGRFTQEFFLENCDFATRGENPFFILEPGYRLILEGTDEGEEVVLQITVLDTTKRIGDVVTRVVEERETVGGELVEVSKNYFGICKPTNSVFYFGEDVDFYKKARS